MTDHPGGGPLAGIRVIEFATVIMGPYGSQLLGDLGADVVKIETASGDGSRVMGGGPHPQLSGIALNLHRNKQSIGIDVKRSEGREIVLRLLADADVFVTNLRPAPLGRLGLDYQSLVQDFPRLIYCQAQGFRSDTDEAGRPAYDDIIQALAGLPQLNGLAFDQTRFVPAIVADKVAGMFIAQGVLAALVARGTTGRGQRVEIPMFDAVLAFNLVEHLGRAAVAGQPAGYNRALTPHRGPHRTSDGYIAMMPYTDGHWTALLQAVGRQDLLEQPYFADHRSRLTHADEVYATLARVVRERTTDQWLELCHDRGIPASPVPDLDDIIAEPEHHRGALQEAEHPHIGTYRQIRQPIVFSQSGQRPHSPAPLVGEQSLDLLAHAGYSDDEISRLLDAGVVSVGGVASPEPVDDAV
jgi:crotonobetainyl-CoA:carnitine CoA-transferase CaiB-like acyl-CoA transferase